MFKALLCLSALLAVATASPYLLYSAEVLGDNFVGKDFVLTEAAPSTDKADAGTLRGYYGYPYRYGYAHHGYYYG